MTKDLTNPTPPDVSWHSESASSALARLASDEARGLTSDEARRVSPSMAPIACQSPSELDLWHGS